MSPRAACRLETLGFTKVYDYVAGKADWLAHGLTTEGEQVAMLRAKHALRHDVPTAILNEPLDNVHERIVGSTFGFALVVAGDGTLLGRLRASTLPRGSDQGLEQAMEPGPSTVRADSSLKELTERLRARDLHIAIVTDPEGRLLGVVRRSEAEGLLQGLARSNR